MWQMTACMKFYQNVEDTTKIFRRLSVHSVAYVHYGTRCGIHTRIAAQKRLYQ